MRNRAPRGPRTNPPRPLIEKREGETDRKEGRKGGEGKGKEGRNLNFSVVAVLRPINILSPDDKPPLEGGQHHLQPRTVFY